MKIIILSFVFFAFSSMASPHAENLFDRHAHSVVFIKNKFGGKGSGLIYAPGVILTNRHVIYGRDAKKGKWNAPSTIYLPDGSQINAYELLLCSKAIDVCAITLKDAHPETARLAISNRRVRAGEDVVVIGHPKGYPKPIVSTGIVSSSVSDILWSDLDKTSYSFQGFSTTAPISPGSSGSPVFSVDGELMGIAVGGMKNSQNMNFVISGQEIKNFIRAVEKMDENELFILKPGFDLALEEKEIVSVIRKQFGFKADSFHACYREDDEFSGLSVDFKMTMTGQLKGVETSRPISQDLNDCFIGVLKEIRIPKHSIVSTVLISQKLRFKGM